MKQKLCMVGLACLFSVVFRAPAADFLLIENVTSATVDADFYAAQGLIQGAGVGFAAEEPHDRLGGDAGSLWVTNDPNGTTTNYFEPLPEPGPALVFDLGSDQSLAEISVWAYATGIEGNSLKDFRLRFATSAEGAEGLGTSISLAPVFTASPVLPLRQSFLFGQRVTARYVELVPLSNNQGAGPGGDRVGFGEVAFESLPVVAGSKADLPAAYSVGESSVVRNFSLPVRNVGQAALTLTGATIAGPNAAAFSVISVPATLAPYTNGQIQLQFNPVGLTAGSYAAEFRVNTNTAGLPVAVTALSASVPAVPADQFYPVSSAVSSTNETDFYKVAGLTGGPGVGFLAEQPHAQLPTGTTWVTNAPNGGTGDYFDPLPDPAPRLVLDLGQDVRLGEISLWGYSSGNANGMSLFSLRFATAAQGAGMESVAAYQPEFSLPFGNTDRHSFDFSELVTARYVEITPLDNYYGAGVAPGGDRVGIGEAAFEKVVTVTGPNLQYPASRSFGTVTAGTVFPVILKNYGSLPVTLNSLTLGGPDAADFAVKSAPASLPALSHGVVELEFRTAGAAFGTKEATLQIASTDPANPSALILLTGTYIGLPDQFHPIQAVTSRTADTDYAPAQNLIQGIGAGFGNIQPHDQLTGALETMLWVTDAPNGAASYFDPAPEPSAQLVFDLGSNVLLSEISVWGYSVGNSNGIRDFQLSFATSTEGPEGVSSIQYRPVFTVEFGNVARNSFGFSQAVTAQYVILEPLNNWGTEGVAPGGDRVGMGEVAFQIGAPVPDGDFVISGLVRNPAGQVTVTFGSSAAFSYIVSRSTNLSAWAPVSGSLPGIAGTMSYTDTTALPAGATSIYYRVSRTPIPN